jgi:hypothetical protein
MEIKIVEAKKTVKFQAIESMEYFEYEEVVYQRGNAVHVAQNFINKKWRYDLWDKDVYPLKVQSITFERM